MPRLDVPDGAALRAHHHGVGLRPTLEEADSAQEIAGGDAGGCEDHVPPRHLVHLEDLLHVLDPHLLRALDLLLVARREPALHVAAHAADGSGRDHAFRRPADAHQHVDAGLRKAGGDGGADVSVADQLDASAGPADLVDQLLVPGPVEDDHRQVVDVDPLALSVIAMADDPTAILSMYVSGAASRLPLSAMAITLS